MNNILASAGRFAIAGAILLPLGPPKAVGFVVNCPVVYRIN